MWRGHGVSDPCPPQIDAHGIISRVRPVPLICPNVRYVPLNSLISSCCCRLLFLQGHMLPSPVIQLRFFPCMRTWAAIKGGGMSPSIFGEGATSYQNNNLVIGWQFMTNVAICCQKRGISWEICLELLKILARCLFYADMYQSQTNELVLQIGS